MIAILAAMEPELRAILAAAADEGPVSVERRLGRDLVAGTLEGDPVLMVRSGVGKVAAAATAALVAERADAVLMAGTAGGLGSTVRPGDVVVADALLQHDYDARPLFPRWQVNGVQRFLPDPSLAAAVTAAADEVVAAHLPELAALGLPPGRRRTGLVLSGDQFVTRATAQSLRTDIPDALAVEMEGAAVAQVCHEAGVPFAVVRTISDRADDDAHLDFPVFVESVAAPYARDVVLATLRLLRAR